MVSVVVKSDLGSLTVLVGNSHERLEFNKFSHCLINSRSSSFYLSHFKFLMLYLH